MRIRWIGWSRERRMKARQDRFKITEEETLPSSVSSIVIWFPALAVSFESSLFSRFGVLRQVHVQVEVERMQMFGDQLYSQVTSSSPPSITQPGFCCFHSGLFCAFWLVSEPLRPHWMLQCDDTLIGKLLVWRFSLQRYYANSLEGQFSASSRDVLFILVFSCFSRIICIYSLADRCITCKCSVYWCEPRSEK